MKLTHSNEHPASARTSRSVIPFTCENFRSPDAHPARPARDRTASPALRLGHVHLKVRDLDRSLPLYIDVIGLRLTERIGRYAFLAAGNEHHSLALEEIGALAIPSSRRTTGVAHFALEAKDGAAFLGMRRKLLKEGVPTISRNNGISWTMRFKDPDGNEIEIYVDRRHAPGGSTLWEGRWHGPLELERNLAIC